MPLSILLAALTTAAFAGEAMCPAVPEPESGPVCRHFADPLAEIERVFHPLWEASGLPKVKIFFMADQWAANAFALGPNIKPNRENIPKIAVTAGLLDEVGYDSNQLAFVLAHEIGHLAAEDGKYLTTNLPKLVDPWMNSAKGKAAQDAIYGRSDLSVDEKTTAVVREFQRQVINPAKKEIEQAADMNALNLLAITTNDGKPVYDTDAAIKFLWNMQRFHPEHDIDSPDSDHPTVSQRLAAVEDAKFWLYSVRTAAPSSAEAMKRVDAEKTGKRVGKPPPLP